MYKPKMFREAEKSTASESLIVNIIVFIVIWLVIMIAESVIPAIMTSSDIRGAIADGGLSVTSDFKEILAISTEIMMRPGVFFVTLLCTAFGTLISIGYCRFVEARHLRSMGMRREKLGLHYLQGLGIGTLLMSLIVGLSLLLGINRIGVCKDINFGIIGMYLVGFFFQGMSEEFIFRGWFMTTLGSRHSTAIAVGVSAAAFSLAHLANPGFNLLVFVNLAMFGVFAALYMILFDDIWGVCGIHSIWNFTQGSFYGISVSGTGGTESILRTTAKSTSVILTGGDFGIEGSLVTTFVLTAGSVLLFFAIRKKAAQTSEE